MNSLNSILLEGVLQEAPVLRTTPKGRKVVTFTLVSKRYFRDEAGNDEEKDETDRCDNVELKEKGYKEETGYFGVEAWDTLAERVVEYGRKGRGSRVVGRIKEDRWQGPDGKTNSKVSIVAEHVEFRPEFKKEASTSKRSKSKMDKE